MVRDVGYRACYLVRWPCGKVLAGFDAGDFGEVGGHICWLRIALDGVVREGRVGTRGRGRGASRYLCRQERRNYHVNIKWIFPFHLPGGEAE